MLSHTKEGKLCLEDQDGVVELDFSQMVWNILLLEIHDAEVLRLIGRAQRWPLH